MTHAAPLHGAAAEGPAERSWRARWRARHAQAAGLLFCATLATAPALPARFHPGVVVQVAVLVVAVALFGIPHGALDPLVGRRWLAPQLGPRWWLPFHAAYLALVAAVVLAWVQAPAATLSTFLAASVIHFGLGDVERTRAPRRLAWAEVLVRGAAPIAVPALAHPDAVRQAFAWVAPGALPTTLAAIVATSAWCARWIVVPGCALFAAAHIVAARAPGPQRVASAHLADAVECLAVPAVAVVLPPFVAFLVYFCLLHSARHALALAAALDPTHPGRAWVHFIRAALPATATTLALGVLACAALVHRGSTPPTPAAVRVLFAGLSALAAPHMLLTFLADEDAGRA